MADSLENLVRHRAKHRCEYCRLPQSAHPIQFQIDHIVAKQHGGKSTLGNLALACFHCNTHKGPNLADLDPETRRITPLFNPRRHKWQRHFRWDGRELVGLTAIGRVTIIVLAINLADYVALRESIYLERRGDK